MSNYIGPKLRPDPLHTHAAIPEGAAQVHLASAPNSMVRNSDLERSAITPCPFCGAEADWKAGMGWFAIECSACGCETDAYTEADDVLAVWNRRAAPSEHEEPALQPGYKGGSLVSSDSDHRIGLHYETREAAEAAFERITNLIDAAISRATQPTKEAE